MCFRRKRVVMTHVEVEEKEEFSQSDSASRIMFYQVKDNDEENKMLVLKLKNGTPICVNFDEVEVTAGNKILAFLIGATVALDGKTFKINEKSFLFVLKDDLKDGSIDLFLQGVKEQ